MYLTDYHTHTCCSPDSEAPLLSEAERALELGLRELCTTDHCDMLDLDGSPMRTFDWTPILVQYQQVREAMEGRLKLRLGLELGGIPVDLDCARSVLSGAPLDFVIGSIHNLSPAAGGKDFYLLEYPDEAACYAVLDDYLTSMLALAQEPECYDVLGHIIYPLRYMNGPGRTPVTLDRCQEMLRAIFAAAIEAGRGIEVNTCRGRTVEEWAPILALYRECGGEIVTVGSDAHTAADIGAGCQQAQALLREAGFRYQAVYQGRRAQFVRL